MSDVDMNTSERAANKRQNFRVNRGSEDAAAPAAESDEPAPGDAAAGEPSVDEALPAAAVRDTSEANAADAGRISSREKSSTESLCFPCSTMRRILPRHAGAIPSRAST